jgi:hypothetical protein
LISEKYDNSRVKNCQDDLGVCVWEIQTRTLKTAGCDTSMRKLIPARKERILVPFDAL